MYLIAGLGNPKEEHKFNRHNTGWIVLDNVLGKVDWNQSSKANAFFFNDLIKKEKVEYFKPTTFMNNSGSAILFEKTKNKIKNENIIVIYDDLDLPLGTIKISFNKSSGGHNGLNSIIKKLKTKEFTRIRVGISPATPSGKIKKPQGEEKIYKFLLGNFKEEEIKTIKKVSKKIAEAIEMIIKEGRAKAMSIYN